MILGADGSAFQASWCGFGDAIPRRWLPARGADQLSGASGLVAWRDEEIFSREQLAEWFDLSAINRSPAKFNPEKLQWLNQQYLKTTDDTRLAALARPFLEADGCDPGAAPGLPNLASVANLLGACQHGGGAGRRCGLFLSLAGASPELKAQHFSAEASP